ncbi:hypothetical protein GCM10009105_36420 [Dokdonella soli]|uniref:Uncharacterized protein n=1 Tax=Dokdonella soli TaxID=529810 RepID=A0ABN1IYI6_9GAMM
MKVATAPLKTAPSPDAKLTGEAVMTVAPAQPGSAIRSKAAIRHRNAAADTFKFMALPPIGMDPPIKAW